MDFRSAFRMGFRDILNSTMIVILFVHDACLCLYTNFVSILGILCYTGAIAFLLYSQFFCILPWGLWINLCMDMATLMALPIIMYMLSKTLHDIYKFSDYEAQKMIYDVKRCPRDDRWYVWQESLYYSYLPSSEKRYIPIAFDASIKAGNVEREIEPTSESTKEHTGLKEFEKRTFLKGS